MYLVGVVGLEYEGVHVCELVSLSLDVLLDQVVLSVVCEDDVHLLGGESTDVRAEHDGVGGLTTE